MPGEEALLRKTMPHNTEAEQSVIASMLMNAEAISTASGILRPEDFYNKQYAILFETMVEMAEKGMPVDPVTLQSRLREKDVPPEISALQFIGDLMANLPTSAHVEHYAKMVADQSRLRTVIHACETVVDECYSGNADVDTIMEHVEGGIFGLLQKGRGNAEFTPISKLVLQAMERIEAAAKNKGTVTGVATGFLELDYKTSGLQPSDFILVAARPSMGKTALALNMAQYVAFHKHQTVAIFSLEMSAGQLVNRMLAMEGHVDATHIRSGKLSESEWHELVQSAGVVGRSNLLIDDTPGITISAMRSKCRKFKMDYDLKLIIIDYLQLMSGDSSKRSESRQNEVAEISRALKALARELDVPVIALSQLSRAVESRPDHRPMMSDLRESGSIEQDADVVMMIYRDDYYHPDSEKKGIAEVIIAKQRNGPLGTVELAWVPEFTKFENMARQPDQGNRDE